MARRLAAGGLALIALLAHPVAPADAQRRPVYRDPPSYRGLQRVPATAPEQQPPLPPSGVLSDTGQFPDVLVDEAGTAHVTWRESRGDLDDAAIYCRVKRGSAACEHRVELTWTKPYGTGDGAQYNTDYEGPKIVRLGEQLVIFSKRYPTVSDKPDGGSSHTVVAWTSSDGGNVWSQNAEVVGKRAIRQMVVAGPADDPSILGVANDVFCEEPGPSAWCLAAYRAGQYASDDTNLSTAPNQNYFAGIALDDLGQPVSISTDAGGNAFARRWGGAGPFTDASAWSPATTFVADGPAIDGGRSGVWMISKTTFNSGPYSVQRLNVAGDGTVTPGPPATVSKDRSDLFPAIDVDPAGRVHAAWVQRGGDDPGVHLRTSTPTGFGPDQRIGELATSGGIAIGAAEDGGGFLAYHRNGGASDSGVIIAGFGQQAATGRPGIGGLQGGEGPVTNVTCKQVDFGRFKAETAQGCFLNGTGANSRLVVTGNEINLHGVRIIPDPGARIVIDPRTLRIDTIGNVRVLLSGGGAEFVLWHGELHRDLRTAVPGSNLFEFPVSKFKTKLLGFPVESDIPVKLQADGVHIPISLELPSVLGGFAGNAEVIATPSRGLILGSLKIHMGPIPIGVLTIKTIDIEWSNGGTWTGRGALELPHGGTIDMFVRFVEGEFAGAGFNYPLNPPATIGPFVYLLSIGGDFFLKPDVKVVARALLGAGAAFRGEAPVKVNGRFTMLFPRSGPASFDLTGAVSLFMLEMGGGHLRFDTDGYAEFGGQVNALDLEVVKLGPITADGFIDAGSGRFGARVSGQGRGCIGVCSPLVKAEAAVSNDGFAACAADVGVAFEWDELDPLALYNPILLLKQIVDITAIPCDTGRFSVPPPRAASARIAQAGGRAFAIGRGLPTATVLVKGDGGAPNVTVSGPGRVVAKTHTLPNHNATFVVLTKPRAGTWTVTPTPGSPAITELKVSNGFTPARVTGRVRGGRRPAIAYRARGLGSGQRIQFTESGRFGTRIIATTTRSRGTLRFRPAAGAGGRRRITALVQQRGITFAQKTVGRYVAPPPPRPGAVRGLRGRKRGSSVTVTFQPARGAARTQISIRSSTGKRLARLVRGRTRKVRFSALRWDKRFTITARSFSRTGRAGPLRRARMRAR